MTPPDLDRTHALFRDLDGTLPEIVATPYACPEVGPITSNMRPLGSRQEAPWDGS